jgi:primosomal protein N' (replication factor Y)
MTRRFKQEDGLRYSGRDLALVRAQKNEAVAVLGSATPSLGDVPQRRAGSIPAPAAAHPGQSRGGGAPAAAGGDHRPAATAADGRRPVSKPLLQAMQATFQAGEQSILFLNRRGFSPLVLCRACGHVLRCTQCAVAMTYHQARALLACHYCGPGGTGAAPGARPATRPSWNDWGTGTERVETLVREHFPTARVARLDRDSAGGRGGAVLERVLRPGARPGHRHPGRHPDGDQGPRLRGGDPGRGAVA